MRPHRGSDQLTSRATPSRNTSRIPGFSPEDEVMTQDDDMETFYSLAISDWTVSTRLAE